MRRPRKTVLRIVMLISGLEPFPAGSAPLSKHKFLTDAALRNVLEVQCKAFQYLEVTWAAPFRGRLSLFEDICPQFSEDTYAFEKTL
jgi:hypothetical protein